MKKISVNKIISLLAILVLLFILALPQFYNIDKKKNTDICVKNMKIIREAIERYMNDREENFTGSQRDLIRTGYLKKIYVCPEGKPGDKYFIKGNYESGEIIVKCPLEDKFPSHNLSETMN